MIVKNQFKLAPIIDKFIEYVDRGIEDILPKSPLLKRYCNC